MLQIRIIRSFLLLVAIAVLLGSALKTTSHFGSAIDLGLQASNAANHDIAVSEIEADRTVVYKGYYDCRIGVTVVNLGNVSEAFLVEVYFNESQIGYYGSSELLPNRSLKLVATFNLSSIGYGRWVLSAYAAPVENETNTENNRLNDGVITVTIMGDVDGSFRVNIFDVVKIAGIYGVWVNDPRFNVHCDLNSNGAIDIADIVICTSHYAQSWP